MGHSLNARTQFLKTPKRLKIRKILEQWITTANTETSMFRGKKTETQPVKDSGSAEWRRLRTIRVQQRMHTQSFEQ